MKALHLHHRSRAADLERLARETVTGIGIITPTWKDARRVLGLPRPVRLGTAELEYLNGLLAELPAYIRAQWAARGERTV